MTITTVGHDLNPNSFLGKLVGGFCALCGIFIMTLPVPIVVNSFTRYVVDWYNPDFTIVKLFQYVFIIVIIKIGCGEMRLPRRNENAKRHKMKGKRSWKNLECSGPWLPPWLISSKLQQSQKWKGENNEED